MGTHQVHSLTTSSRALMLGCGNSHEREAHGWARQLADEEEEEERGALRGNANDRPQEEEEDDEEEEERRAPERRPMQVELHRDCPYLDTVNR
ncbi:hypothetical protein TRIUR3_32489 [Triticum urartu]|uniref:Uncharacterized protein n=1 Tax=Triticum urartu TaxID=4572 RepID=M7YGQ9_TRIUA|nr:hypothetical protein TRIUR3_32489 [Triticum urartu]